MRAINRAAAVIVGACLLLTGCALPQEDEQAARNVFEQVRTGQFDALEETLTDELDRPETRATLETLKREYIPSEPADSIRLIRWSSFQTPEQQALTTVHQYAYPDRVLLVTTILVRNGEAAPYRVNTFNINPITAEAVAANRPSLGLSHYAFMLGMLLSLTVMVLAFIGVIRTKGLKWKWLWCVGTLAGAPVFAMNLSTGVWQVLPSVGLINTMAARGPSPIDPWILQGQLPVGALLILIALWHRKRKTAAGASAAPAEHTQDNAP